MEGTLGIDPILDLTTTTFGAWRQIPPTQTHLCYPGAPGPREAHNPKCAESGVYRRSGGDPWQKVHEGLPPSHGMLASVVAANKFEPGVFYAANNKGVFRSAVPA